MSLMIKSSTQWGVVAGVFHHLFFQYPRQSPIFTTLSAYVLESSAFGVGLLYATRPFNLTEFTEGILLFGAIQVVPGYS